jgi:hypothetical protein
VDGPVCGDALRAFSTQTLLSNNLNGLGNPQETLGRFNGGAFEGILRDYTGRDCDVQEIVQPANPSLGGQGKPDAGS